MTAKVQRAWTDDEIGFLADHEDWTGRQIAEALGRSYESVKQTRTRFRRGIALTREFWSQDEDDFLRSTPNLTAEQQAKHLNRSFKGVKHRRSKLAQRHGTTFNGPGNTRLPSVIGSRPLVAKTCTKCGLLLSGKWFAFDQKAKYWRSECYRCHPRYDWRAAYDKEKQGPRTAASKEKLQQMTLPTADRRGFEWLAGEHEVLADPDLSIFQKAIQLRRTYIGVSSACSKNGYRSKNGLGDPERDQWRIDNPNQQKACAA